MKDENQITQFRLYFDLDKEIAYINSMNKKGWKLVYIKLGCLYTFIKSEPDEYVTMYYAEKKEDISKTQAFAAQCGYESIPHSSDGFGDLLYLTGKKSEISDEFVSDIDGRLASSERIYKKFHIISIVYIILDIFLALESCFFFLISWLFSDAKDSSVFGGIGIVLLVFTVLYLVLSVNVIKITKSIKRQIKKLRADKLIYE